MAYLMISSGISIVFGAILTIILYIIFKNIYDVYSSLHPEEIRLIFYSFSVFFLSGITIVTLNVISFLLSIDSTILGTKTPEYIHDLSYVLYNLFLSVGLALFIYNEMEGKRESANIESLVFPLVLSSFTLIMDLDLILSSIVAIEALILISISLHKIVKKEIGKYFYGKLWILSLGLIFLGRMIDLTNIIPMSQIAILYLDLFAFTTLLILQLEIKMGLKEGEK